MGPKVDWSCPLCGERCEAESAAALTWRVAGHIRDHEDQAAVAAVLRAQATCPTYGCKIGGIAAKDHEGVPYPTDFDKKFMKLIKIEWN